MTPAERQGAYLYTLLTGKDPAKKVRAFSLTAFLARPPQAPLRPASDRAAHRRPSAPAAALGGTLGMAAALTASIGTLLRLALDQRLRLAEAGTAAGACTGAR
jgi:hypothetical protein